MATFPTIRTHLVDKSNSLPVLDSGRKVFIVILSDRGRHNVVVQKQSYSDFENEFGAPNFTKTGLAHYIAKKALLYTSKLYVIRAVLLDSETESNNAAIANAAIKYNDPNGSTQLINGEFQFLNEVDATSAGNVEEAKKIYTNAVGYELYKTNDYIYSDDDDETKAVKIISKTIDGGNYYFTIDDYYQGTSTDHDNDGVPSGNTNSYQYFPGSFAVLKDGGADALFTFTQDESKILCDSQESYESVNIEDWIYPNSGESGQAVQVISKEIIEGTPNEFYLLLSKAYTGATSSVPEKAKSYIPFEIVNQINVREESHLNVNDPDNIWYFRAIGAGTYYNDVFIQATRNIQLESQYLDNDTLEPLYKYAFMDITIYKKNSDGTNTILEGPWSVSLIEKTLDEQIIRDINSGNEMYIEQVINRNSKYIKVLNSVGSSALLTADDAEDRRLQVLSMFSDGVVTKTDTRGLEGFFLQKGEDGIQYDSSGRLNVNENEIKKILTNAYNGTLKSPDGSIGLITQAEYPKYKFDYCVGGGYPSTVQNAAREFCDIREDCMALCDSGSTISADEDLANRGQTVAWNTPNAMLYSGGYYKIFLNGQHVYMTPIYNALERHLIIDNSYFLSEPVANINKGIISDAIELAYQPTLQNLKDIIAEGMNPIFDESNSKYFATQTTTYKRLSVLRNANVMKFIHFLRQEIPPLLKDVLQNRAVGYWLSIAQNRVLGFLRKYIDGNSSDVYHTLQSASVNLVFSELTSELALFVNLKFIRNIESIDVFLNVS